MRRDWSHLADAADLRGEEIVAARVEPREIGYINAILEGHEGLSIMRTADPRLGIVCFWVPRGQRADFDAMIAALRREVSLVILAADDPALRGLALEEWNAGAP